MAAESTTKFATNFARIWYSNDPIVTIAHQMLDLVVAGHSDETVAEFREIQVRGYEGL